MVHEPIKVIDYSHPIESTRKELMQEEDYKIKGRRGMILKGFKTEKERIEETIKNNDFVFSSWNQQDSPHKNENEHANEHVVQPRMRFKPRTDLERVFDEVNKNSFGRVDKNLIQKQLKKLDLNVVIQPKENEDEILDFQTLQSLNKFNHTRSSILHRNEKNVDTSRKNEKKVDTHDKRRIMNQEAKNLMSDLHIKTHFKAAAAIAIKLSKLMK
jgi:hypothetical protein